MSTVKSSSRSRGTAASVKENGVKLEEGLNPFKSDRFDAEVYVQSNCSLNDKEIKQLCTYLVDLKRASAEEMRRSVYANYAAFIRTSKEISDLEGELSSIRNLLSTQATLIHALAEGVHIDSLSISDSDGFSVNVTLDSEDKEISDLDKWLVEFPDLLDVLLAERRVEEALAALDEGERVVSEAKEMKSLNPSLLLSLQNSITERRQKLADQLAEAACQPSTRGAELRASISALKKLGDGPNAHSLLLNAHLQRYQYNMQSLRPSSTSYGGAYTAALAQLVFSAVAQAASDSLSIFGGEPAYASELVMWATKQTEAFALLVKRHALASSAAAGGLRAAAECVQIALGHCSLLEARGLALCPVLLKLFRPSVEQALDANLKRIQESTAALAAADDWVLTYPPNANRQTGSTTALQHKLTSSAHRFNLMVQDFFEDVGPLLSMQLGGQALEGLFQVFNTYVNMLIKALPESMEEEESFEDSGNKIVRMAETEAQQVALLANASLLADELLPRAAMKLAPLNQAPYKDDNRRRTSERQNRHPEQREWRRRLVGSVDRLKDTFCRQHALDLIFTEEGDSHLTADMYINMDGNTDEVEWFPSLIFQELFVKLNRMANIAADMFVGRERFATLLLMRLTETVILWLSEDQSFWDDIEEGPRPLGLLGLQQFYLDMKFVVCFASNGRYLSRNLQRIVNEIITKAMAAFSATGMDPYSELPEDEWFNELCQDAMERLSGKPKEINGTKSTFKPLIYPDVMFEFGDIVKECSTIISFCQDLQDFDVKYIRRTSKEISDLEGELSSIRNLLSTQATLIHALAEGVHIDSLSISDSDGFSVNVTLDSEDKEISDLDKWLVEFPDLLDVLLAERRVEEALAALDEGERVVSEAKEMKSLNPSLLLSLQNSITERRQKLADQLAEAACQPSTRGAELRASISALKKLGDGPNAHSLLLNAHLQRYQYNMQSLRPSSTSYGGAYTAALAQLVFSAVAQAASDSLSIFGGEPAYASELVMWATKQTEAFALLVKRHALASSAAAGGLRAAAECVQIALGHCSLLEARGLALCPVLLKLFRPSVEQALDANLKRIQESTAALAAADDWVLTYPPNANRQTGSTTALQHKLTSSAHRFNLMVQDFFEDVGPLLSMQLGGQALEGLFQVFNTYVNMLIKALPESMEEEESFEDSGNKIVRMAETEAQQVALLANASLLADELLPRAAMKLAPLNQAPYKDDNRRRTSERQNRHPEQREWRRRLVGSVDRLKDTFCRQHALDLIFTEEGDSHLTADMYINMDGNTDEVEWFPSLIFQELFVKLNRMANIAADMFVGRERFATLLLMRLTETVILWLSEDQSFWDDIEEGPRPLGLLGLQQFYLDMKFVVCFASNGRYLSRNLQRIVNEIITKAMAAFSATGMDPYSELPEDEWFNELCQDAMERLSGKPKEINGERDPNSPTASVSAQSISSVRSHNSS